MAELAQKIKRESLCESLCESTTKSTRESLSEPTRESPKEQLLSNKKECANGRISPKN